MRTRNVILAAIAALLLAVQAQAGHFCHNCGCQRNCRKVCRLECGKKKETKTEYSCECEDFCVPGHSKKCGVKVECDCNGHRHRSIIWQPVCAKVHTRKKLVKKDVTKEVPDYKWVVEEYCCVCGQCLKVDGKDAAEGRASAERLPLAADENSETIAEQPVGDYRAYYVGAEAEAAAPQVEPTANVDDDSIKAHLFSADNEDERDQPRGEPRRLLLGLFGR